MSGIQRPRQPAPAVQQLGGAVLVQGEAVSALIFALSRAIDARRRHGKPQQVADLVEFRRIVVEAYESPVMSRPRRSDVAVKPLVGKSNPDEGDWITVAEAVELADLSRRQIQRIARAYLSPTGAARRVGTAWCLDRAALVAYLTDREDRTA